MAKRHNKGGQSALRFSRLRDESEDNYIKKVAEKIIELLKPTFKSNLFIIGNAHKKNLLGAHALIQSNYKQNLIYYGTIESTSEISINEFLNKNIKQLINGIEINQSNQHIDWINNQILNDPDTLVFGYQEIMSNISLIKQVYYMESSNVVDKINSNSIEFIPLKNMDSIGIDIIGVKYWAHDLITINN